MHTEIQMSPERHKRIRQLLALRQPSLTLCLEQLDKPHNVSAIVRSCDAVGVHEVQAIWNKRAEIRKGTAMGSENWVYTREHTSTADAVSYLKQQNMQVLVTNLSDNAVDFRQIDYSKPTAIIVGQEKHGVTNEAIALADQEIVIPMVGMVQSLNVSVAAALILYEAQRQRQIAGMYDQQQLCEAECQKVLFQGGFPRYRELCDRKNIKYPYIDELGNIQADETWWKKLQASSSVPYQGMKLRDVKGFGIKSEEMLAEIDIHSVAQFMEADSFELYKHLKQKVTGTGLNSLYTLIAAREGKHRLDIANHQKAEILLKLESMGLLQNKD